MTGGNLAPFSSPARAKPLNIRLSETLRALLRTRYQKRAKRDGAAFVCSALQGLSDYNICIQCDLSVTCNCQDMDGTGQLGSMQVNTFEDIFFGDRAESFRRSLADGHLPLLTCARCPELVTVSRSDALRALRDARLPSRGIMVENTIACDLDCPGCIRPWALATRTQNRLALEQLEVVCDTLARLRMRRLYYLNRGEPFLSPTIQAEMRMLRSRCPDIYVHTASNGLHLDSDSKREAALLMDEVEISIDGIDNHTVTRYQRGGSFDRSYDNMRAIVRAREAAPGRNPMIEWKYLLFNWNDHPRMLSKATELAQIARVDTIFFQPVNNPFYGVSWRARLGLLNHVGTISWRGREVRFSDRRAVSHQD